MNKLTPGKKRFVILNENREIVRNWDSSGLNWKVNVVCEKCNNGWMSDIENDHAQPAMTELIAGKLDIPIDQKRADSIALFGFKTAVVLDHLRRDNEPFFERSVRHEFRKSLTIPTNIRMWLTGFLTPGRGEINTLYGKGSPGPEKHLELYVCTYAVERLVIQIAAFKENGILRATSKNNFSAVPFCPKIDPGFVWPPVDILRNVDDFNSFSDRWGNVIATF